MAWQSEEKKLASPGCFMFAGVLSPNAGMDDDRQTKSAGHCVSLTKFDPLPDTEPGVYCFPAMYGATFGNHNSLWLDVSHHTSSESGLDCIGVKDLGALACFNVSSVVPYSGSSSSGEYVLEEIEVFTIQF